jgi:hypothetical protein
VGIQKPISPDGQGGESGEGQILWHNSTPGDQCHRVQLPLDQSDQAWCHLWLSPLIIDERWEKMYID